MPSVPNRGVLGKSRVPKGLNGVESREFVWVVCSSPSEVAAMVGAPTTELEDTSERNVRTGDVTIKFQHSTHNTLTVENNTFLSRLAPLLKERLKQRVS
jgi:hypothetical protein